MWRFSRVQVYGNKITANVDHFLMAHRMPLLVLLMMHSVDVMLHDANVNVSSGAHRDNEFSTHTERDALLLTIL